MIWSTRYSNKLFFRQLGIRVPSSRQPYRVRRAGTISISLAHIFHFQERPQQQELWWFICFTSTNPSNCFLTLPQTPWELKKLPISEISLVSILKPENILPNNEIEKSSVFQLSQSFDEDSITSFYQRR